MFWSQLEFVQLVKDKSDHQYCKVIRVEHAYNHR